MGTRDWELGAGGWKAAWKTSLHYALAPLFQGGKGVAMCTGQRILDTKSQKLDVKKLNK